VRLYRQKYMTLLLSGLMSIGVPSVSTLGIYLAAKGLPGEAPTMAEHFLIVPLAMLAGAFADEHLLDQDSHGDLPQVRDQLRRFAAAA
jgi:hypothetical protein